MDFPQQLEACVKQANQALSRFIAPLPFQNTPVVETMQYGALLVVSACDLPRFMPPVICLALAQTRWTHPLPP